MRSGAGVVVIGVGNPFRRDDGIGWAVVSRLSDPAGRGEWPPGEVDFAVSDGEPARLIALWEGAELAVVVDAARVSSGCPGRVHRLELTGAPWPQAVPASSHGLGLGDAVELARALDRLPAGLLVLAVEGQDCTLGTGLSAAVSAAVEPVAERIRARIVRHLRGVTGVAPGGGPAATGSDPASTAVSRRPRQDRERPPPGSPRGAARHASPGPV